jgi:hypothetical protein
MYLTDRRCAIPSTYISAVAQNRRSTLSNWTEGSLVKIAQVEGGTRLKASRSLGSISTKPQRDPSRGGRY